tara:strand:+ start:6156 stop:6764 length:609 start_codon:yes stop_codon:yes gene_type:complete
MTDLNTYGRQPTKLDYASPIQFRFKCIKLPKVEFFCQSANIPGISLGEANVETPLVNIPFPGDKISYGDLNVSFLVDENLNNYKELHDWMIGLGFPKNHTQYADVLAAGNDRFPQSKVGTATQSNDPGRLSAPLSEGAAYSDATLTVLNSKNIAKTEIRFKNIYPIQIGGLSYDIKASDVDYLQVSATFKYMYYDIVQISTS